MHHPEPSDSTLEVSDRSAGASDEPGGCGVAQPRKGDLGALAAIGHDCKDLNPQVLEVFLR